MGELIEEALCKSGMENEARSKQGEPLEDGKVLSVKCLAERLHARDGESDESFIKRLRTMEERVLNVSKVVVRVGPMALAYEFHTGVVNLVTHSVKLSDIIVSTFEEDGKGYIVDENGGSVAVIDLPDFQCDAGILRIVVEDFCLRGGVMEENVISISNVVRLFNAAKFLQIEGLQCATQKFLEKNVFDSWENCLDVLATFDCNDVLSADLDLNYTQACLQLADSAEQSTPFVDTSEENTLFEVCRKSFLRMIKLTESCRSHVWGSTTITGCSIECLVRVAQILQPNVAEIIYKSCRAVSFGLLLKHESSWIRAIDHQGELYVSPSEFGSQEFLFKVENVNDTARWTERLSGLLRGLSRISRSHLVSQLSKMVRLIPDLTGSCRSWIEMGFVSALLVEATHLKKRRDSNALARRLAEEIVFLEKLVAKGLGGVFFTALVFGGIMEMIRIRNEMVTLVMKFNFRTLLSIVEHFRCDAASIENMEHFRCDGASKENMEHFRCDGAYKENIANVAIVIDRCIVKHIEAKWLTIEQAWMIYNEFPNHLRKHHADRICRSLRTATFSAKNLRVLTKLVDYDRLSDDNLEKLFKKLTLKLGCDRRLLKVFVKIQARKQKKKDEEEFTKLRKEDEEEFMKLQNEIDLQTLDLEDFDKIRVKLRDELRLRTAELTQERMEKER